MAVLQLVQCPAAESIPGKVSGAWVFKGTYPPVATVIANLDDGVGVCPDHAPSPPRGKGGAPLMLKSTQAQPPCANTCANFEVCYAEITRGFATVALLVAVVGSGLSAQTLGDRVREFGREHPNAVYRFPRAPVDFAGPQTIEGIARNADVVVQCKLAKGDTRLVADEVVVTDYAIVEPLLLAGRLPAQQTSQTGASTTPMTLSVWGGKMVVHGVPVEAVGGYAPKEGSTYILFLRPARRSTLPNTYELYAEGIFETDGDKVIPLFRDAINVFGGTIDRDVNAFTARIRNAVPTR